MLLTNLKASRSMVSILLREEVHYDLITIVRYEIYGQGPSFPTRLQAAMVSPLLTVDGWRTRRRPLNRRSNVPTIAPNGATRRGEDGGHGEASEGSVHGIARRGGGD
jgi:hypothetical protein